MPRWLLVGLVSGMLSAAAGHSQVPELLVDLVPGPYSSAPMNLQSVGGVVVFDAFDGTTTRLFRTDGSVEGTFPLADGTPLDRVAAGSDLLFLREGSGLARTDGTVAGTYLVNDSVLLAPFHGQSAWIDSGPFFFTVFGDEGAELWTSDGTASGTAGLGPVGGGVRHMTPFGAGVAFWSCGFDCALWRSDGSSSGTGPFATGFDPQPSPRALHALGSHILTMASRDGQFGLWRTDGTAAGTVLVQSFPEETNPEWFWGATHPADGRIYYFLHREEVDELWTATSTGSPVQLVSLDHLYDLPTLAVVGRHAVFATGVFFDERPVWMTDGTVEGTRIVVTDSFTEPLLVSTGSHVVFTTHDEQYETWIWSTDGTEQGTMRLGLACNGDDSCWPEDPVEAGGRVFWLGDDGPAGLEIFMADGPDSARRISEFDQHPPSIDLAPTVAGTRLIFTGVSADAGQEPWMIDLAATCSPDATTLCLGPSGRFAVTLDWHADAEAGSGRAHQLTADSGTFWFFDAANVEAIVKVLDACDLPSYESFWVFAAGLTNVGTDLVVRDTWTGAERRYMSAEGSAFESLQDTRAFETCDATPGTSAGVESLTGPPASTGAPSHWSQPAPASTGAGACVPSETTLCLGSGRFRVEATWGTEEGATGTGHPANLTDDTGTFWFFGDTNVELVVKVVDACELPASGTTGCSPRA